MCKFSQEATQPTGTSTVAHSHFRRLFLKRFLYLGHQICAKNTLEFDSSNLFSHIFNSDKFKRENCCMIVDDFGRKLCVH